MKVTKTDRKNRGMDLDAITDLLNRAPVGRVATISTDGTPYVVPVNFAFEEDRIYFHCALEGMKLDYIKANPKVGFETDEMTELLISADRPCACGCNYRSVIARGNAHVVVDQQRKLHALKVLVKKYASGKENQTMPGDIVARTVVVEIIIDEISGKAHLPDKK
jgi:nitroimidazol reductase NimA-like FMN-containing flavoprotein (pyridoxamine 5'-phosphate oxidase superfamily)